MTHKIFVDIRERGHIIGGFEFHSHKNKFDFKVEEKTLPVGDVLCEDIVIERKDEDKGDFISSMISKDKRLECQLEAMQQFKNRYVIIVGDLYDIQRNISRNCINGMLAKMAVDYETQILQVPTTEDYIDLSLRIINRIVHPKEAKPQTFFGERRILTQKEILINMVGQIQGIGQERATTIIEDFEISKLTDFVKLNMENYKFLKSTGRLEGIGDKIMRDLVR